MKPRLVPAVLGVPATCRLRPCNLTNPSVRPSLHAVTADNSRRVNHFPNEVPQGHPDANDSPVRMVTDER